MGKTMTGSFAPIIRIRIIRSHYLLGKQHSLAFFLSGHTRAYICKQIMCLSVLVECPYHRYKDISTSVSVSPRWTFCLFIEANKFVPKKNTSPPMYDRHEQRLSPFHLHRWTNRLHSYRSPIKRMNEWPNWMCTLYALAHDLHIELCWQFYHYCILMPSDLS